jgi:hypothetical protein
MMIVITRVGHDEMQVLKVDGHLSAEDVDVLLTACDAEPGCLVLDLSDLRFADRRGVGTLRELRARGVRFAGLSPYLSLVLAGPGSREGSP